MLQEQYAKRQKSTRSKEIQDEKVVKGLVAERLRLLADKIDEIDLKASKECLDSIGKLLEGFTSVKSSFRCIVTDSQEN